MRYNIFVAREIASALEAFLQSNRMQYSCFQGERADVVDDDSDVEV
jgi:hypothetical protein